MKAARGLFAALLGAVLLVAACDDDGSKPSDPGTITVHVNHVLDQNGKLLMVGVFPYDWQPGAEDPPVALLSQWIDSADFSYESTADSVSDNGAPTGTDAILEPGVYSIVFFVIPQGTPPEYYAEVRSGVDGNISVSAPAWENWIHLAKVR